MTIEALINKNKSIIERKLDTLRKSIEGNRNGLPEMTKNEISKIKAQVIKKIFEEYYNLPTASDEKGEYIILNKRKIYVNLHWNRDINKIKNIESPILWSIGEWLTNEWISISIKEWNKYYWIYYNPDYWVYRWELIWWTGESGNDWFLPKNYESWKRKRK